MSRACLSFGPQTFVPTKIYTRCLNKTAAFYENGEYLQIKKKTKQGSFF